jgi:hypothetical protein
MAGRVPIAGDQLRPAHGQLDNATRLCDWDRFRERFERENFEDYVHVPDGVEFWFARDLQELPVYDEWRNFSRLLKKLRNPAKLQTTRF